jgi:alkanesulfonate monooxygenase SsuD/methylene tetrahydromethanopterin reductase-like flavin-dependent oxidoreductase (luciferase family)
MVERAAREATARAEARNAAAPGANGSKKGGKNGMDGRKGPTGAGKNQLTFEQMVEKGYVILGDPTQVTEQIHELCLDLNVGHLLALAHFGNMSKDLVKYNTKLIGEKVLPELRGLFEDEWEDRWWPEPMPAAERQLPDRGPSTMGVDAR